MVYAVAPEPLYRKYCKVCHGDRGDGMASGGANLQPPPTSFRSFTEQNAPSRESMIESVVMGRPGTTMVGYARRLSSEQIALLVDYIRETFMAGVDLPANNRLAQAPSRFDLQRGQQLYVKNCAACHGDRGNTAVWAKNGLKPAPRDFTSQQARAELSFERMIASVTDGRAGTAMMSFKKRLTTSDIEHVVSYIRQVFMGLEDRQAKTMSPLEAQLEGDVSSDDFHRLSDPGVVEPLGQHGVVDMSQPFPLGLAGDQALGKDFFMNNCAVCHGKLGQGNGPRAHFNDPQPRNFTSAAARQFFNRPRLFEAISHGKVGTVMPAWATVLDSQTIANVAEFVFQAFILDQSSASHSNKKKGVTRHFNDDETVLAQGKRIYEYRCYFCHGYAGDAKTLASSFIDPPARAFTGADSSRWRKQQMITAVQQGRKNTAMQPFVRILSAQEIEAVVDYIYSAFIRDGVSQKKTRYHSVANGWDNHERYVFAYPFATGELSLTLPWEQLNEQQQMGKQLYVTSCISCHDRGKSNEENDGAIWRSESLSYPRNGYSHQSPSLDSMSSATPFKIHDRPKIENSVDEIMSLGAHIFRENCAFCHADDGTGRHWIGSFILPPPADFTAIHWLKDKSIPVLKKLIADGVEGSAMPAWKTVLKEPEIHAVAQYIFQTFNASPQSTSHHH